MRCHIVAFEEEKDIFDALLKPMIGAALVVVSRQPLSPLVVASQDLDLVPMVPKKFSWKFKFSK